MRWEIMSQSISMPFLFMSLCVCAWESVCCDLWWQRCCCYPLTFGLQWKVNSEIISSSSANYSVKVIKWSLHEPVEVCLCVSPYRISCTDVRDRSERAVVCVGAEGWRKWIRRMGIKGWWDSGCNLCKHLSSLHTWSSRLTFTVFSHFRAQWTLFGSLHKRDSCCSF